MDVIFIYLHFIYYCGTLTSYKLIMLSRKILSFSKLKISKKNCEGKYIVFYNIQEYFTFYIESSNSLIILQNICVEIKLVL
jgi:hypothetical protein